MHGFGNLCCCETWCGQDAAVTEIVAKVQGIPGEDRCVILAGYPEQMEKMIRDGNPGLARRFQVTLMNAAIPFDINVTYHLVQICCWFGSCAAVLNGFSAKPPISRRLVVRFQKGCPSLGDVAFCVEASIRSLT